VVDGFVLCIYFVRFQKNKIGDKGGGLTGPRRLEANLGFAFWW